MHYKKSFDCVKELFKGKEKSKNYLKKNYSRIKMKNYFSNMKFNLKLGNLKIFKTKKEITLKKTNLSKNYFKKSDKIHTSLNKNNNYQSNFKINKNLLKKIKDKIIDKSELNFEKDQFLLKINSIMNFEDCKNSYIILCKYLISIFNTSKCHVYILNESFISFYANLYGKSNLIKIDYLNKNIKVLKFIYESNELKNEVEISTFIYNLNKEKDIIFNKDNILIPIYNYNKILKNNIIKIDGFIYLNKNIDKKHKNRIKTIENNILMLYKLIYYKIYIGFNEKKKNEFLISVSTINIAENLKHFLNILRYNIGKISGFEDVNILIFSKKTKEFIVPSPSLKYIQLNKNYKYYIINLSINDSISKNCFINKNNIFIDNIENSGISSYYDNQTPINLIRNIYICSLIDYKGKILGVIQYVNKLYPYFIKDEKNNIDAINKFSSNMIRNYLIKIRIKK